jgi:hypothetical protein
MARGGTVMRTVHATCFAAVVACGTDAALQGNARIDALFSVPSTGVSCIRLVASGMKKSVQRDFAVASGESTSSFDLHGIPTGTVMFSGSAYAEACSNISGSSIPTWVADDVTMTVNPGPAVAVQLSFHPNGNATVNGSFVPDSFTVSTLAGVAGVSDWLDGTGNGAHFQGPGGLAFDGADTIYIGDAPSNSSGATIRKVSISTGAVTTLAGSPVAVGTANGAGNLARFTSVQALALSGGTLYIGDRCALRAMTTTAPYTVTTPLGTPSATNPQVWDCSTNVGSIADIAVRGPDLYVADQRRAVISKISTSALTVTPLAGTASLSGTADGPLASAQFLGPSGLVFSSPADDALYVADYGTLDGANFFGLVRRVSVSGNSVTTVAGGEQTSSIMADGLALNALFAQPSRFATDGTSLFLADRTAIRRIDLPTAAVVTIAGNNIPGSADGAGGAAGFRGPSGIARNAATRAMYVADQTNFTIRALSP